MRVFALVVALSALVALPSARADNLESDVTWSELSSDGRSFVFGRIEGRFDGTEYRGRKLRVRSVDTGKEHTIRVDEGRGYFEAALPVGTYRLLAIEAVYFPPVKWMRLNRFPPVKQRYVLQPIPDVGIPTFPVAADTPVYLGTIRSGVGGDSLVYEGHALEIVDEYDEALSRLASSYRVLLDSMSTASIEPLRYFFLKPVHQPSPFELANVDDPLAQARDYIEDEKYEQAMSWLETFMPMSDGERAEVQLLEGEIYLADQKYEDAIEQLGNVLMDDPENLRALRLLARAHALEGNREDAIDLYGALAETLPEDAEANLHLGFGRALEADAAGASRAFDAAFAENFDYLLHDLTPYAMALKADGADYAPPQVKDGAVKMPSTMRSRRSSNDGGFGVLLDQDGKLVAVHVSPSAGQWAPAMLMTLIRARFFPARLNGVPIPCLIIIGAENVAIPAQ